MLGFHPISDNAISDIGLEALGGSGVGRLLKFLFPEAARKKEIQRVDERRVEIVATKKLYLQKHDDLWEELKELSDSEEEYQRKLDELTQLLESINALSRREERLQGYIKKKQERFVADKQTAIRKQRQEERAILLLLHEW